MEFVLLIIAADMANINALFNLANNNPGHYSDSQRFQRRLFYRSLGIEFQNLAGTANQQHILANSFQVRQQVPAAGLPGAIDHLINRQAL